MKKLKYLFITLMIALVGFLAFSIRNYLPILALGNVSIQENDTFSNDLLVDLDYYNSLDDSNSNLLNFNPTLNLTSGSEKWDSYGDNYPFNWVIGKTYHMKSFISGDSNAVCQAINFNWHNLQQSELVFTYDGTKPYIRCGANYLDIDVNSPINLVISYDSISSFESFYFKMFGFAIHSDNTSITNDLLLIDNVSSLGDLYYLPFDISENGKISFNYTFSVGDDVTFNKIVINNKINGVSNNKLKLQYYYSNFSLGFKSMSFIDDVPSDNENWYGLIFQSDPPQIKIQSGKHSVYYANFKSEIYNFISQDDFIDHNDYLEYVQVLGFSSFADSGNEKRTISFESLVCSSFGSGGGTYIPDNPSNDYEFYLPVSGPFDFVPILTNAFTWIIYHVPIIGPIVNLFRSARVMFTSVVSLGELFSGFGIIFSIFIICLILYIIKKLYGGDN